MNKLKHIVITLSFLTFAAVIAAGCGEPTKQYGQLYKDGDTYYVRAYNPDHKDDKPKKGHEDDSDWFIWYMLYMNNGSSLDTGGLKGGTTVSLPSGASWKPMDSKPDGVDEKDALENEVVEMDENGEPVEEITDSEGMEIDDEQITDETTNEADVDEAYDAESYDGGEEIDSGDSGGDYGGSDDSGSYDSGGDFGGGDF